MHESDKTTVNPYLTFAGNCREAMEFYKSGTNGELEIMPFEGAPVEVPDDYRQNIMHSTLRFGDAVIMASDSMPGQEVKHGNGNFISIAATSIEEAESLYNNLSAGGQVVMPFEETFWDAKFGMFIDKFGIGWMVNCEVKK